MQKEAFGCFGIIGNQAFTVTVTAVKYRDKMLQVGNKDRQQPGFSIKGVMMVEEHGTHFNGGLKTVMTN